jgi:hypothetical protein
MHKSLMVLLAPLLLMPLACDDDDEGGGTVTPASIGPDLGPPAMAQMRIAHLSPNKPPIDVCVAPHGSGQFTGPLRRTCAATPAWRR